MIESVDVVSVVAYALLVLSVGVLSARRGASAEAYFLADRSLGPVAVFGTTFSTFFGTGLVFTLAAFGYRFGVGAFALTGAAVVGFLLLLAATPRIKETADRTGAITLPALLGRRWSGRTRLLAALVTAALFTGTLAASFLVVGDVLGTLAGVPARFGTVGFALLVVGYTSTGGFRGVVWTDGVQTGLIVGAFVLAMPAVLVVEASPSLGSSLPASHLDPFALPLPAFVAYLLVGAFAFFGSQDVLQRIFAARDVTAARRGLMLFTVALAVTGTAAVGLGIVARALQPDAAAEGAVVALARALPWTGLGAFALLGFLALANSDADSQVLTVASNVTQDLLARLDVDLGPRRRALVNRLVVLAVGAGALLVALGAPHLAALLGTLGSWFAMLGLVVVATLFWERTTDHAAFGALAVGFASPLVVVATTGNAQAATVAGLVSAAVVLCGLSLASRGWRGGNR